MLLIKWQQPTPITVMIDKYRRRQRQAHNEITSNSHFCPSFATYSDLIYWMFYNVGAQCYPSSTHCCWPCLDINARNIKFYFIHFPLVHCLIDLVCIIIIIIADDPRLGWLVVVAALQSFVFKRIGLDTTTKHDTLYTHNINYLQNISKCCLRLLSVTVAADYWIEAGMDDCKKIHPSHHRVMLELRILSACTIFRFQ